MRINDLLLLESEMLLESYRDFNRVWTAALPTTWSGQKLQMAKELPTRLENLLRDAQRKAIIASSADIKWLVTKMGLTNPLDITSWLSRFNSLSDANSTPDETYEVFLHVVSTMEKIIDAEIKSREPIYDTIKKTSEYIVFDVKNFAAAKKLRNQVKATWCIGASEQYFDSYGENRKRKTIIVFFLKKKEGMVFHVDQSGGGLITSHDNQREWDTQGGYPSTRRGTIRFAKEMSYYLDITSLIELVKATGMKIRESELEDVIEIVSYKHDPSLVKEFIYDLRKSRYTTIVPEDATRRDIIAYMQRSYVPIFTTGDFGKIVWALNSLTRSWLYYSQRISESEAGRISAANVMIMFSELSFHLWGIAEQIDDRVAKDAKDLARKIRRRTTSTIGRDSGDQLPSVQEINKMNFESSIDLLNIIKKFEQYT